MSQVQLFSHPDLGEIKATIKNGDPWFLAGDVCRVLEIKNSRDAVNEIVKKLFDDIAPRFSTRKGGYTRLLKLGPRLGDNAEMVLLELVSE